MSGGIRLLVARTGPLESKLREDTSREKTIEFLGLLAADRLKKPIEGALAVVVPSECYENAPMSVLEAFAYGKPVVGARIGGITEMIEDGVDGYLFEAGNVDDLREKLELMLSNPRKDIEEMGRAAVGKVEREYNAELHYQRLMELYKRALA